MLVLALTTLEKLQQVPRQFWINVGIAVVGLVLLVYIIRKMREMNIYFLIISCGLFLSIVWFHWIYERDEPKFMTPIIDVVAEFFPTKGKKPGW